MIIILPDWYAEAEEELDKVINETAAKNIIDYGFVSDSKAIEDGKSLILNSLVKIYENVGVEQREKTLEFLRKIQPKKVGKANLKRRKTSSRKIRRT